MYKTNLIIISTLTAATLLFGCSSVNSPLKNDPAVEAEKQLQSELIIQRQLQYQERLDNLAIPFEERSTAWCGKNLTSSLGVRVGSIWSYESNEQNSARKALGLDEKIRVLWTIDGSAAKNDFQPHDNIISINGQPLAQNQGGLKTFEQLSNQKMKKITFEVLRDGKTVTVESYPVDRCNYPAIAVIDSTVNAYNDGSKIVVYSGLMNLFPDDRDLAVIFGHELAHGTHSHISKGIGSNLFGIAIDTMLGGSGLVNEYISAPFSRRFEAEADYTGLYMLANAGYDLTGAEHIWREMGINSPATTKSSATDSHPTSPERFIAIRKTIEEIQTKQQAGVTLMPLH